MQGQQVGGAVKYLGAVWMSALAREYPEIRLLTISPGGTRGTDAYDSMPTLMGVFAKLIFQPFLSPLLGLEHSLETGSRRIADGLFDPSLRSGHFYASSEKVLTGPIFDQNEIFKNFGIQPYRISQPPSFGNLRRENRADKQGARSA